MERDLSVTLRLVLAIEASPRLRALLEGVGYTPRDHRLAWRLVSRRRRVPPTRGLLLRAFVHAWSRTALELVERDGRLRGHRQRAPTSESPVVSVDTMGMNAISTGLAIPCFTRRCGP